MDLKKKTVFHLTCNRTSFSVGSRFLTISFETDEETPPAPPRPRRLFNRTLK